MTRKSPGRASCLCSELECRAEGLRCREEIPIQLASSTREQRLGQTRRGASQRRETACGPHSAHKLSLAPELSETGNIPGSPAQTKESSTF